MSTFLVDLHRADGDDGADFPLEPSTALPRSDEPSRSFRAISVPRADHLDVPVTLTVGGGLLIALAAVFGLRLAGASTLAELLLERGWTQYAALGLSGIAVAFLILKAIRLSSGLRTLRAAPKLQKALPAHDPSQLERVRDKFIARSDPISIRRARALQAFLVTGRRSAAAQTADEDAVSAQTDSEASFSIPRVIIWAIPLMGFIGTVIGISAAIAGFSGFLQQAEEIEQIKSAIGGVTTGLAVAFDTTLVALALSVLLMLPLVLLERLESRYLGALDANVSDTVVSRLPEGALATADGSLPREKLAAAVDEAIAARMPSPEEMVRAAEQHLRTAAMEIASQATVAAQGIKASADALRSEEAEVIRIVSEHFEGLQARFESRTRDSLDVVRAGTASLSGALEGLSSTIAVRLDAMNAHSAKVNEVLELERSLRKSVEALHTSAQLEATMRGVDQSLSNLKPALEQLSKPRQVVLVERIASTDEHNEPR